MNELIKNYKQFKKERDEAINSHPDQWDTYVYTLGCFMEWLETGKIILR